MREQIINGFIFIVIFGILIVASALIALNVTMPLYDKYNQEPVATIGYDYPIGPTQEEPYILTEEDYNNG